MITKIIRKEKARQNRFLQNFSIEVSIGRSVEYSTDVQIVKHKKNINQPKGVYGRSRRIYYRYF